MLEIPTGGDVVGEGGADGVVVEGEGGEVLKTAEEGRERAGNVGV